MPTSFRSTIAAVVLCSLAGCATQPGGGGYVSPIQAQADDFKLTVAQGAVAGALVGAGIAALTGGDTRKIVTGALAGGAVGAVGGYYIAGQKQSYARREDAIEAMMADSRQRSEKLTRVLSTTDQVIARRRTELARLKAANVEAKEKVRLQQALVSELELDQKAIEQAINSAREHGTQMDGNIAQLRQQFPDANTRPLDDMSVGFNRARQGLEQKPAEIRRILEESRQVPVQS